MDTPTWNLYTFSYAPHENRSMSDPFLSGNPNELSRDLDAVMVN